MPGQGGTEDAEIVAFSPIGRRRLEKEYIRKKNWRRLDFNLRDSFTTTPDKTPDMEGKIFKKKKLIHRGGAEGAEKINFNLPGDAVKLQRLSVPNS